MMTGLLSLPDDILSRADDVAENGEDVWKWRLTSFMKLNWLTSQLQPIRAELRVMPHGEKGTG